MRDIDKDAIMDSVMMIPKLSQGMEAACVGYGNGTLCSEHFKMRIIEGVHLMEGILAVIMVGLGMEKADAEAEMLLCGVSAETLDSLNRDLQRSFGGIT